MENTLSNQSLDDIFKGNEPDPSDAPAEQPAEALPDGEKPDVETAAQTPEEDDVTKGETAEETPPEPKEEEPPASEDKAIVGLRKALKAERKGRQEAEEQLRQQTSEPEKPTPDVLEDSQGFSNHIVDAVSKVLEDRERAKTDKHFARSKAKAEDAHDDYLDMEAVFMEHADPALQQEMLDHEDPSEFAYTQAAKIIDRQNAISDLPAHEQKIRDEAIEKFKAELEELGDTSLPDTLQIPQSLANQPSVAKRAQAKWAGPDSLEDTIAQGRAARQKG